MDVQTLAAAIAVAKKINNTEEYVTSAVSAWLNEHVDPETGYVVDNTLAVEGAAADSKAAGDAIALKTDAEKELDTRVNALHALVNYGYDTPLSGTASGGSSANAYSLTVKRTGTLLKLSGSCGTSGTGIRVKLNASEITVGTSSNSMGGGITLIDGHTYRLRQHKVSGSATVMPQPYFTLTTNLTKIGTNNPVTDANGDLYSDVDYNAATYENGLRLICFIARTNGNELSDLVLEYTLEDLTARALINGNGVKMCLLGDSIAAGYVSYLTDPTDPTTSTSQIDKKAAWATKCAQYNNWQLTNLAVGGAGFIDPVNGKTMGTADAAQGWYIARHTDFTPYNLVVIAYGINDWKSNGIVGGEQAYSLGDVDDPTEDENHDFIEPTTVCGAFKTMIEAILKTEHASAADGSPNPNCKVIVLLPQNCLGYKSPETGVRPYENDPGYALGHEYSNTGTLESYVQKLIEVCDYYGVQYVDLTHYGPINRANIYGLLIDGVHPSKACHELLAHELSKKLTF